MNSITSPPVFIIGNPRSGTTLLRLMLNNHENIMVPPECGFAVWWHEKYQNWSISTYDDSQILDQFIQDLSVSKKIDTWNLNFENLRSYILSVRPSDYSKLVSSVYAFFGHSLNRTFGRWGDKNNFHIRFVDLLHSMFPDAYFIHIIRDGRDVACSYRALAKSDIRSKYAPNLPTDIASIATEWSQNIELAVSSFQKLNWQRVHQVKYEHLVDNSQMELVKICHFLGEPFDDQMLNFYVKNREQNQEPLDFLQWKTRTLEAPTTAEVGKYRLLLTEGEIAKFNSIARRILIMYGYECVS